jgi:predicted GH43/DUF377 family glycosyl hydrolase
MILLDIKEKIMKSIFILIAGAFIMAACGNNQKRSDQLSDPNQLQVSLAVTGGNDSPVLARGMTGTEDNKYGFEGGTVIQRPDGYHLFTAEMVGEPHWVKMKLGHWLSKDGINWRRIGTLFESSGDFTGRDPKAALWSPMPFFNEEENRWNLYYVGYRSQPDSGDLWLGNYEGRIYRAVSKMKGIDGIGGPYEEVNLILEPGKDSDPWEGLQGTDSFFPYISADGRYYGFYGSAQTQYNPIPLWQVGLASAEKPEGPWKRCSEMNPLDNGLSFIENPVVTRLSNGLYIVVVDAGYDSTGLNRSAFGYCWSRDGIHWSEERLCYLENKVQKWWKWMRTPLCLIQENDSICMVFHTAYDRNDYGSVGMIRIKLGIDTLKPVKYLDNRPIPKYRMDAEDVGVVLHYGNGPDSCDYLGVREAIINKENDIYYLFYDGAGPKGWLACLAISTNLVNWEKKGPILDFGKKGEPDQAAAASPWVIKAGNYWHMLYFGTPNTTPAPDLIPSFPYLTLKAKSRQISGPWIKQKNVIPMRPRENSFYSSTCSPGYIIQHNGEYLMYFSGADYTIKRTIGIARTKDIDGSWQIDSQPIVPPAEQIENSSMYFEKANQTWFLFTNHIAYDAHGEYTDAVWVYWSKDPEKWDPENKAIVLDGINCKWSNHCIGMPTVIRHQNRLALLYDAPGDNSYSHMRRSIGLAFLKLPLTVPGENQTGQ